MSSPWRAVQPVSAPMSLIEIESEQLAQELQEREIQRHTDLALPEPNPADCELFELDGTDSDEVIAHMLQAQYNREHDLELKRIEDKFNGESKVGVSYLKFRASSDTELEDKKPDVDETRRDFDRFVSVEKEYASMPRCGYKKVGKDSKIVTKHDMLMSSRINACRVLQFPPGICTGDTGSFDVKLNNKVFNSLRAHSQAHCSRERAKARPTNNK
ncbi:serine/threonine-protein kinase RIO3 [Cephus cinctus]|uniref:Serine/threonine-protein kinase RIO3 n=1 Tax=Cephus cinctus TaxID=211228 RepID=A0AAJ7FJP0_CEPCN|nr:serine/threonine-protein kinase RIO3 [Cephus cinctus]XP_015595101.1 serine/threonine-protein kinase RIO3 [Cephus cinctus]XP_015595107.1 serine/threonine-protein kinase RIO3 [Cephus cinctus]XP_024940975.1 serine/threonine-protein kinase RIO3 [Cephus cinctus]